MCKYASLFKFWLGRKLSSSCTRFLQAFGPASKRFQQRATILAYHIPCLGVNGIGGRGMGRCGVDEHCANSTIAKWPKENCKWQTAAGS